MGESRTVGRGDRLSKETITAVGPSYKVSMPGEVKQIPQMCNNVQPTVDSISDEPL